MVLVLTEYHGTGTRLWPYRVPRYACRPHTKYLDVPWVLKFRLTEYQVVEVPPYRVPGGDLVNIIGKARAPSKHFWGGMWSACGVALGLILNPRCYHAFDILKSLQHTRIQIIFCGTHRVPWCWYSALASTEHRGILMGPTPSTEVF